MGGATNYDRDKALAICERLIEEPHLGLRQILRDAGIAEATFRGWRKAHPDLDEAYKEAKEQGFDALAQQALSIADTPVLGEIVRESDKEGRTVTQEDMLGHRKLQVETRLKLLAKWYPKKYGDKLDLNHGGAATFSLRVRRQRDSE